MLPFNMKKIQATEQCDDRLPPVARDRAGKKASHQPLRSPHASSASHHPCRQTTPHSTQHLRELHALGQRQAAKQNKTAEGAQASHPPRAPSSPVDPLRCAAKTHHHNIHTFKAPLRAPSAGPLTSRPRRQRGLEPATHRARRPRQSTLFAVPRKRTTILYTPSRHLCELLALGH